MLSFFRGMFHKCKCNLIPNIIFNLARIADSVIREVHFKSPEVHTEDFLKEKGKKVVHKPSYNGNID